MSDTTHSQTYSTRKIVSILGMVAIGMFAFGFALVPLYRVFCSVTGYNGYQQGGRAAESNYVASVDRTVTIQFDATTNANLPVAFRPQTRTLDVHPGQQYEVNYIAVNNSERDMVTQAVPGVTPWQAAQHFRKIECFCFTNQTLLAGESRVMPLTFFVSPKLPEDIGTLTLSYSIMDIDPDINKKLANTAPLETQ